MNSGPQNKIHILAVGIVLVLAVGGACTRKKAQINKQTRAQYQTHAHLLCTALLDCVRKDAARALKNSPERKGMVLSRMSRDLCIKNQYRRLGDVSSRAGFTPKRQAGQQLHVEYAACARAVAAASTCQERKQVHRTNPNCTGVRARLRGL